MGRNVLLCHVWVSQDGATTCYRPACQMFQRDLGGVPRGPSAVKWSADGKIAVCVEGGVAILSPLGRGLNEPPSRMPYRIHYTQGWEKVNRRHLARERECAALKTANDLAG